MWFIPGGNVLFINFQYHSFYFKTSICYFFVYWRGVVVHFLTPLYSAAWNIIFLYDFWISFYHRTTITFYVLIYCNFIGETVPFTIEFIYLVLGPENISQRQHRPVCWCISKYYWREVACFSQIYLWWCLQNKP